MARAILFALLVSCVSLPALANTFTVGDLDQICSGTDEASDKACRFYILGAVDGASIGFGTKTDAGPLCIAENVPISKMQDSVKKLLQADLIMFPQDKALLAAGAVAGIAMKAFPCEKPH